MVSDRQLYNEHDTFKAMTDALEVASACATRMGDFRPDQRRGWEILAEAFKVNALAVWKLAEEAATKGIIK